MSGLQTTLTVLYVGILKYDTEIIVASLRWDPLGLASVTCSLPVSSGARHVRLSTVLVCRSGELGSYS